MRVNEHLTTLQPINTATASTCTSLAGSEKDSKPNESKEEMLKRLICLESVDSISRDGPDVTYT